MYGTLKLSFHSLEWYQLVFSRILVRPAVRSTYSVRYFADLLICLRFSFRMFNLFLIYILIRVNYFMLGTSECDIGILHS